MEQYPLRLVCPLRTTPLHSIWSALMSSQPWVLIHYPDKLGHRKVKYVLKDSRFLLFEHKISIQKNSSNLLRFHHHTYIRISKQFPYSICSSIVIWPRLDTNRCRGLMVCHLTEYWVSTVGGETAVVQPHMHNIYITSTHTSKSKVLLCYFS